MFGNALGQLAQWSVVYAMCVSAAHSLHTRATDINTNACATAGDIIAQGRVSDPRARVVLPADIVYACLQSVPNRLAPAIKLVQSVKAFAKFQSTLAWLKDPPQGYPNPAVDILGGLDKIESGVSAGQFRSEYDFQLALANLINSARDGHFLYLGDIFSVFVFRQPALSDLVPVSQDGVQAPKLYHLAELQAAPNGTYPPALVTINGEDAVEALVKRNAVIGSAQDDDASWNQGFLNYAKPDVLNNFAASLDYLGTSTILGYDNGTKVTLPNQALIRRAANFSGIRTGDELYNRFCDPYSNSSSVNTFIPPLEPLPPLSPYIEGYPWPAVRDTGFNSSAGYFLNGTGYDDVAVFSVIRFFSTIDVDVADYAVDFQRTLHEFLQKCKAEGKKRLVIDLVGNNGGYFVVGQELFAQLFPGEFRFQAHNFRLTETVKTIAETANTNYDDAVDWILSTPNLHGRPMNATEVAYTILLQSPPLLNYLPGDLYNPDGTKNLTTVYDVLAPVKLNGDVFGAYQNRVIDYPNAILNMTGTPNTNAPPSLGKVFAPEDITILTDIACGSTCTTFVNLLTEAFAVKTVAVGGRPGKTEVQAAGAVEGGQLYFYDDLSLLASASVILDPKLSQAKPDDAKTDVMLLDEGYAYYRAVSPMSASVNGKNSFSRTNASVPWQFLSSPANCRFFYTPEMYSFDHGVAANAVWKRAVDAAWTDEKKFCSPGSVVPLRPAGTLLHTDPALLKVYPPEPRTTAPP